MNRCTVENPKLKVYAVEQLNVIANIQLDRLSEKLGELATLGKISPRWADQIVDCLQSKKEAAIDMVADKPIAGNHVPLLCVINPRFLNTITQMQLISGVSLLPNGRIYDGVDRSEDSAHWLYGVQKGDEFLDYEPEDAEVIVKERGDTCLTATDAILLAFHTDVLKHHNLDTGSRFEDESHIIDLSKSRGKPQLSLVRAGDQGKTWGMPSYKGWV